MTDVFVGKYSTRQVEHHLMHVNQNLRSIVGMKGKRLNVGVDLAPLFGPIRADFVSPTDTIAFKRFRPSHGPRKIRNASRLPRA